jgi:hypothetical protein
MYTVFRHYKLAKGASKDELARKIQEGAFPMFREVPGFRAYYLLDLGDRVGSFSVFDDRAGADESIRRSAAWVKEHIAHTVDGAPEVLAGDAVAVLTM